MNVTPNPMADLVQLEPDGEYARLIVRRIAQQVVEHHLLHQLEELGESALKAEYGRHEEDRATHATHAEQAENALMAHLELPDLHLTAGAATDLGAAIIGAALEANHAGQYQQNLARRQRMKTELEGITRMGAGL